MPATRHSVCAVDCPDACSLLIDVDENGRGSKLRGNPHHPVTRGFLCGKVARYLEREYSPGGRSANCGSRTERGSKILVGENNARIHGVKRPQERFRPMLHAPER
ncbi:MAG: hypothetical protein ABJC09_15790 [Terriglobia bacterium]